jgi:hypothetical protein
MKTFLLLAALLATGSAWAQSTNEAIPDYTASIVAPVSSTAGWTFEATANLIANGLGCFTNVFTQNSGASSVEVGLWDQGGSLLASAAITPGSTLVNESLYETINPVYLSPGQVYYMGLFFPPDGNLNLDAALSGSFTATPDISVRGTALAASGGALLFPDEMQPPDGAIYAGPNLQYQEGVPEPASGMILLLGGLLLMARRGKQRL